MIKHNDEFHSIIFSALRHKIRREILLSLAKGEKSFTELCGLTGISSSHLDYHLDILNGLLKKSGSKYMLSESGKTTIKIITQLESPPTPSKTKPSLNIVFKYTTMILVFLVINTSGFYHNLYEITLDTLYNEFIDSIIWTLILMYPITLVGFVRDYWLAPYIQSS